MKDELSEKQIIYQHTFENHSSNPVTLSMKTTPEVAKPAEMFSSIDSF